MIGSQVKKGGASWVMKADLSLSRVVSPAISAGFCNQICFEKLDGFIFRIGG